MNACAAATLMPIPRWSEDWAPSPRVQPTVAPTPQGSRQARMPVWVFASNNGARVISSLPVEVFVEREVDPLAVYVFSCPSLHVFASGETYKEAEDSFHEQVVHFFYSYRAANPDELADDAAAIRQLYARHFQESAPPR